MTGPELSDSDINAQPPQVPAESLSGTATAAGEINGLPERIMTSNEKIESDSKPESREMDQAMKGKENAPSDEHPLPVLYKVQYLNNNMDVVFSKENKEPMEVQSTLSALGKAVVEVITDVRIVGSYKDSDAKEKEPRTAIITMGTMLKINSPAIITALQSVIEYYPDQSVSEDSRINEPYAVLIHHEEELKAYRDQFNPEAIDSKDELCRRNANAYEHLGILQTVLSDRSGRAVETERQRHARGFATFEMLWLLYKPGIDVYCDSDADGNYSAYVVKSVSGGIFEGRTTSLQIDAWYMDYDGNGIGRRLGRFYQSVYDGEKEIRTLTVFPCKFWKEESKEEPKTKPLKQKLEERGKMFFKLAQRQCMDYDGTTRSWPKKHVSTSWDRVIYF